MIFFLKADGTLIKSAPDTVYQGSEEAGKIYVVAPLNAGMLVDVYYELPNGERWGAYLLENNGKVIDDADLPEGWALWSTSLASAITQYAGTLKAQFGFYQSGTADKVPLITSQAVAITIAKGVVRDLPEAPTTDVYEQILNALSSIKQDIANLPNEYLANTNEDKIALKNNSAIEYSENATSGTIVKRDSNGKINVVDGTEDLNAVNVRQFNAALTGKVDASSVSSAAVKDTIAQRTSTGQLKASDGVADDDLATVKQLNAAQGNYTDITNIDLNTGDTTVEYDTELGITVNAKGTVTHKNGNAEQPTTKFKLPIVSGDGIFIDKAQNEEKISVKVDGKVTKTPNSIVKRDSAGRVKTADAVSDEDAASYGQQKALRTYTDTELLKKLDRTGGTITGNLIVSGNLSVSGEASVIESTTLKVADKLIYVAKDNTSALTSPAGVITPKYDGTNDGGLVYDNSGTAYVGDIKLDSNGNVDVNTSDLQPIATRDVYSNFTNGHKVKAEVDSSQKSVKFIDGGKDDGINSLINADLTFADTTVLYDATNGIQLTSKGRFTYADGNHDATMDLALPVVGKDGIVIDKAADSEKIEVSGKNLIKDPYPGVNNTGADIINYKPYNSANWGTAFVRNTHPLVNNAGANDIVGYDNGGVIYAKTTTDDPWSVVNKEYADNNFVKKITTPDINRRAKLYAVGVDGSQEMINVTYSDAAVPQTVPFRDVSGSLYIPDSSIGRTDYNFAAGQEAVNKKYVDDAIASIHLTSRTKYQHNLVLEGSNFKAFMSIPRSKDNTFYTLDDIIQALESTKIPCTGYIHDGERYYSIFVLDTTDTTAPKLIYLHPVSGEQVFEIISNDVAITDNPIAI